jgi:hypothetical protein
MKNKATYNIDLIYFAMNLIFFSSVQTISFKSNQKFISLIDNFLYNDKTHNKDFPALVQLDKTRNLNTTNYLKNQNSPYFKNKIIENLNPFFESSNEDIKLISSNFLGTVLPKHEEIEKADKIDCTNLNVSSENYDLFRIACNNTNLLELNMQKEEKIKLFKSQKILDCNNDTCRPGQGKCISDNQCDCNSRFVDNPDLDVNMFCSYKQKRQLIFFLTEFFAPIGVGHVLNGRFLYGIIKCSVIFGLIMVDIISKCVLLCGNERGTKCPNYISFFYFAIIVFWQAYDITMIGFNKFKEENGISYIQVEI